MRSGLRAWWFRQARGWVRLDGFRIDTPDPSVMEDGAWFGLAFQPGSVDPIPGLIKGLKAADAMDRIDGAFPLSLEA